MVYNPATDFLGLWRASGGNVSKVEMPGLDYVLSALARAGIVTLSVSATAPVVNQSITAWLRAAVPSYSAEGAFFLWDKVTSAYLAATPALFLQFLEATAGENGTRWWTSTGGAPLNTVGNNGDFALRLDTPYGIYGPKAAGAWPANAVPGTEDLVTSVSLDNTFGTALGSLIYRGVTGWQALPIGANNDDILISAGGVPAWFGISTILDDIFSSVAGSLLYRTNGGLWAALPPGVANQVLATGGPGANPAWAPRAAEFPSGTRMVFQQTAAPTGWTKDVSINDYGLRVVSGAVSIVPGSPFSTVFAQTQVGAHALTIAEMPVHSHGTDAAKLSGSVSDATPGSVLGAQNGAAINNAGNGDTHTHTVNLTLAYTDVIIASKD